MLYLYGYLLGLVPASIIAVALLLSSDEHEDFDYLVGACGVLFWPLAAGTIAIMAPFLFMAWALGAVARKLQRGRQAYLAWRHTEPPEPVAEDRYR